MLPPSAASEAAPAPGVQGTARAGNTDGGVGAEQLEELRARLEQIPEMQRQLNELRSEQGKQVRSARSCECMTLTLHLGSSTPASVPLGSVCC